jgi:hypothetical protein
VTQEALPPDTPSPLGGTQDQAPPGTPSDLEPSLNPSCEPSGEPAREDDHDSEGAKLIRADRTRQCEADRQARSPAGLNATARKNDADKILRRWLADTGEKLTRSEFARRAREADGLLRQGFGEPLIRATLWDWAKAGQYRSHLDKHAQTVLLVSQDPLVTGKVDDDTAERVLGPETAPYPSSDVGRASYDEEGRWVPGPMREWERTVLEPWKAERRARALLVLRFKWESHHGRAPIGV